MMHMDHTDQGDDHHTAYKLTAGNTTVVEVSLAQTNADIMSSYTAAFSDHPWHEQLSPDIVRERLIEKTAKAQGYLIALKSCSGILGGAQFFDLSNHRETAAQMPEAMRSDMYLSEIWIAKKYRGFGLGTRLLESIEQAVASLSYRQLVLRTHPTFEPLLNFYHERGYSVIGHSNPGDGNDLRPVFSKPIFAVRRRAA
jgi:GNAT superfamily N-acetyltransferase